MHCQRRCATLPTSLPSGAALSRPNFHAPHLLTRSLTLQVLLLDEATSALDSSCEKAVQSALEALMPGRTCVMVAHRLSTVTQADSIQVLKNGVVAECGSHRQLLELGGLYASLAAKQAMRFGDGEDDVGAPGSDGSIEVTAGSSGAGGRGKGPVVRPLRESVLRRGSVRLSIMPQASSGPVLLCCCADVRLQQAALGCCATARFTKCIRVICTG